MATHEDILEGITPEERWAKIDAERKLEDEALALKKLHCQHLNKEWVRRRWGATDLYCPDCKSFLDGQYNNK